MNIPKDNMYYSGRVIKYEMSKYGIENLEEGSILMGTFGKGWVGRLKSGYNIPPLGHLENAIYHLKNDSVKFKHNWFAIDGKHLQIFYKQSENIHNSRFIDDGISQIHELLKIKCNMINLHLETNYNFDINNPNLIRNNGQIKKDQVLHCDFKTSIIPCTNVSKNNNQINVETAVISTKRKRMSPKKSIQILID